MDLYLLGMIPGTWRLYGVGLIFVFNSSVGFSVVFGATKACQNSLKSVEKKIHQDSRQIFEQYSQDFLELIYQPIQKLEKRRAAQKLFQSARHYLQTHGIAHVVVGQGPGRIPRIDFDLQAHGDLFAEYLLRFLQPAHVKQIHFDLETLLQEETEACTYNGVLYLDPLTLLQPRWNPTLAHEALHLHFEANVRSYFFENIEILIDDYATLNQKFGLELPHEYHNYYSLSELACYQKEVEIFEQALQDPLLKNKHFWQERRNSSVEWKNKFIGSSKVFASKMIPQLLWSNDPQEPSHWVGSLNGKTLVTVVIPYQKKDWHPRQLASELFTKF